MNQDEKMQQLRGFDEISETSTTVDSIEILLTKMAVSLLKEMAQDHNGMLMAVMTLGGDS